ncbi:DUF2867 domain-containing protein [Vibrio atypicus]|uniref:DUF2867 domain-containing protein n=1 Tax=Vibrio atypicus TaxID=558271 RepID=UPI001357BEC5|nr:DUF2867 domain-containing protein [Vibrio atypicus]
MEISEQSLIEPYLDNASFADSFSVTLPNRQQSAFDVYLSLMKSSPDWVNRLMALRNRIVSLFGLKNLGTMSELTANLDEASCKPGDRIGIFTLVKLTPNEVLAEDCDKHLNVRLSFLLVPHGEQVTLHVTTAVHVKNWLGRVYMLFVAPMHKLIVPASLKALEREYT